jgi:hypothetical protein
VAGLGKRRAGPVWKGWAGWAGWFLGLGPSTWLGSFLFLSPFYSLFQTPLNLKPFEFKFKFEFNPSTQTKEQCTSMNATTKLNLEKILITCKTKLD